MTVAIELEESDVALQRLEAGSKLISDRIRKYTIFRGNNSRNVISSRNKSVNPRDPK
ncbi:hypothetical protein ABRG53_2477 [Pseudanabaena sp. ABRG5-3]|nr:hypothetical protein ABRG53_2477 [Pseudanabaena sp. ABRG5-3]